MCAETMQLLRRLQVWAPPPVPDVASAVARVRLDGAVLEPGELRGIGVLLASTERAGRELRDPCSDLPLVAELRTGLRAHSDLRRRLERAFDDAGGVADGASRELDRVRAAMRAGRSRLVARLERFSRDLDPRIRVPDASVTVRGGRYCVPVRREGRSEIGGIVHDESASRRTVFVEPPAAIEAMNGIRELELEEEREVRRVLTDLSAAVRRQVSDLAENLARLAELDGWVACARYGLAHGGSIPILEPFSASARPAAAPASVDPPAGGGPSDGLRLRRAFHPLLLASGAPAVPFDLTLMTDERVLLVSGPNAGGKTVLLKTIGLMSALAQSGVVPPVGEGTRLPLIRQWFAVIGDEQSIDASLSTFGARLRAVRAILEEAGPASLVLLDEIGGSTDPEEGAALAAAVLLRLAEVVGLTVATTHLGKLKSLASEDGRVVNASLRFDVEALRPTFDLVRDRPGRSFAFEMATSFGIPKDVIGAARARVAKEVRELDLLLARLELREGELARLESAAEEVRRDLERRESSVNDRERRVGGKERELEREALERERDCLLRARAEVEEVIAELRSARPLAAGVPGGGEPVGEAAARRARGRVERLVREVDARRAELRSSPPDESAFGPLRVMGDEPGVGAWVRVERLGVEGRVAEVRAGRALIEAGALRLEVPVGELRTAEVATVPHGRRSATGGGRMPRIEARPEVDVRGLRADEIDSVVLAAIDAARVADLPTLRIVHGKGTGALRRRVQMILEGEGCGIRFRGGAFDEGGAGVTVVQFREAQEGGLDSDGNGAA